MITKLDCLLELSFEFILEFSYITRLVKPGNSYFTKIDFVSRLLKKLTLEECIKIKLDYQKGVQCEDISYKILYNNPNAGTIRKEFMKFLYNLTDEVGYLVFEVPIPDSRVDIARINHKSYAYEIKSKRDTTKRLNKQLDAMSDIFEINYVIISKDINPKIENDQIGIYKFNTTNDEIEFILEKEAQINTDIDCMKQLSLFSSSLLTSLYEDIFDESPFNLERTHLLTQISHEAPPKMINEYFKQLIISKPHQSLGYISDECHSI